MKSVFAGLVLNGSGTQVRAVENGTVLFAGYRKPGHRGMPVPSGGILVIAHDGNIRSVYGGLSPDSVSIWRTNPETQVNEGQVVAQMAGQGDAGLIFMLHDNALGAWINPSIVLPVLPDDRPPILASVQVKSGEAQDFQALFDRFESIAQEVQIRFAVRDPLGLRSQSTAVKLPVVMPLRLSVVWNGTPMYNYERLALRKRNSSEPALFLMSTGGAEDSQYAYEIGLSDISHSLVCKEGVNRLEIRAEDVAGNKVSAGYRILYTDPAGQTSAP